MENPIYKWMIIHGNYYIGSWVNYHISLWIKWGTTIYDHHPPPGPAGWLDAHPPCSEVWSYQGHHRRLRRLWGRNPMLKSLDPATVLSLVDPLSNLESAETGWWRWKVGGQIFIFGNRKYSPTKNPIKGNENRKKNKKTPVESPKIHHWSSRQVVDAMLESRCDGEARGVYGKTAAHCAVQRARNLSVVGYWWDNSWEY